MKKRVFISASIICVAILGLFVAIPSGRAATLYSQTTDSQTYSGGVSKAIVEGIIQLNVDLPEAIWTSITLRGHCNSDTDIIAIGLGHSDSYWNSYYGNGNTATTTCSYGAVDHDYVFNFNIDVATEINNYRETDACAPEWGANNCWVVLGTSAGSNFVPRVKTPKDNYGIYQYTAPAGAKDESFYYILGGVSPDSIDLTFPVDTSSISDFSDWILDYNYQEFPSSAFIFIKSSTNDLATCEGHWNEMLADGSYCFKDGQALYNTAETGYLLDKGNILAAGNYNAEADLGYYTFDEYGNPTFNTILSDTITFTITGAHPPDWTGWFDLPTSTTSTSPIITCDPNDGLFQYSLCKLGLALFMPSQNSLTNFSNLGNMIKTKAPIGYFYLIQTSFNSLSTSTEAFSLGDLGVVSTYVFTPFRTGISFILWVLFGVWLFNRIKNFNL